MTLHKHLSLNIRNDTFVCNASFVAEYKSRDRYYGNQQRCQTSHHDEEWDALLGQKIWRCSTFTLKIMNAADYFRWRVEMNHKLI